jgi:hypothetical protein
MQFDRHYHPRQRKGNQKFDRPNLVELWHVNLLQIEFPHVSRVTTCLGWCSTCMYQYPKDLLRCTSPLKPYPHIDFHQVLFLLDYQIVTSNYIITLATIEM